MKLGRLLLIIIILSFFTTLIIIPQVIDQDAKITTINIMINRVFSTRLGMIVEYYYGGKVRRVYMPNAFFQDKTVVRINEDDYSLTPQMNVIYKDQVAYKIKLYIPTYPDGFTYQVIEYLPQELVDKFKNTTKIEVVLKDENQ